MNETIPMILERIGSYLEKIYTTRFFSFSLIFSFLINLAPLSPMNIDCHVGKNSFEKKKRECEVYDGGLRMWARLRMFGL